MQSARMGLVGKPSEWLVASIPDFETISHIWGLQVVEVDFDNYFQQVLQADSAKNMESLAAFISGATHISSPDQTDFKKSIDIYIGLQEVIEEHKLDALSVRCFDLVTRYQATGCYALSQLNDRVMAGCKGDLVSTIGMLWAKHLLEAQTWMANPARIDKENNKLRLAHCTISLGMT